jgi:hypothetical protein
VYGYFLYWFSYRLLVRVLPRPLAMLITFVACGFVLHDLPAWLVTWRVLPPGATIAFLMFGVGAILGERLHMDLSRWPVWRRATINVCYLAVRTGDVANRLFVALISRGHCRQRRLSHHVEEHTRRTIGHPGSAVYRCHSSPVTATWSLRMAQHPQHDHEQEECQPSDEEPQLFRMEFHIRHSEAQASSTSDWSASPACVR